MRQRHFSTLLLGTGIFMLAYAVTASSASEPATDDGSWGTLTGQVVVSGEVPESPAENAEGEDKAICLVDGQIPLDDNIVAGENGELRDVIVMMYLARDEEEPDYHPSYAESKGQAMTIDNVKCRFEPHALFVRTGQPLTLKNSDSVGHNCHITTLNNEHNITLSPNSSTELVLTESEKVPGNVTCDIHRWMDAVIMVRDNPYVAITDADGKFTIENVPAGNWKFQLWHKKVGYLRDLEVPDKEVGRRGEFEVEIPADGTLDLGQLNLPAESFKE
jgi:plastocyanin